MKTPSKSKQWSVARDSVRQGSSLTGSIQPSRRRFVQGLAVAGLAPAFLTHAAESKEINFVSYGGSYGKAVNDYLVKPFEAQSGIKVALGVNSALAPLKIQVTSKNVQWDLAEIAGGDFFAGLKDDLFEPLDTSIVDLSNVPEYARHEYGVEYALFLSGMGYDQKAIGDAAAPRTWKDFWDTSKYKGVRALSKHISDASTLEAALMADGVPIDQVYPIDIDRALSSLEKLGKSNIHWFEHNQEPVNFLEQQQGPLAQIASGRVAIAARQGAKIAFVYNEMQITGDYLVVPKGAKNKEAAFQLINFILTNDAAAADWMTATTYAIANTRAAKTLPPELADKLPTSPKLKGKYFTKDFKWWGANREKAILEFQKFIAT